jgi:hypothetical protein
MVDAAAATTKEVATMLDAPERRIPATQERAMTELIRCRRRLASARESLELAVGILRHLNGEALHDTSVFEGVIGDLEQVEARLLSNME